jgi:hypothetical protein
MAYVSTEEVSQIREQIKPVLKELGFKGSIKRLHYSKVVLTIKTNGALINQYTNHDLMKSWYDMTEDEKSETIKYTKRRDEIQNIKRDIEKFLKLPTFFDHSDAMTDYFHVSYYTDIRVEN